MPKPFKLLIDSYLENNVGQAEDFLDEALALGLKERIASLQLKDQFILAGTGNNTILKHDRTIRSDKIYWLDRTHKDLFEDRFLKLIDRFVLYLNSTCYTNIIGYEFHFAVYDEGSFYKRHLDVFKDNRQRAYSMIMYLNQDWKEGDGGELCVYIDDLPIKVSPLNRKAVFFKSSELEHEVLLSHKPRLSITGWFKTR